MTIYSTSTDADRFHHLVTDEFVILQQLRIQPAPCKCLVRDENGPWRWITRIEAEQILAAWQRATEPKSAA